MKNLTATFGTLGLLATMLVAPMAANASSHDRHAPRQRTSNVRLHVSIGSAVLGFLGFGGRNDATDYDSGGARYSRNRYNEDGISNYAQRRDDRANRDDQSDRNDRGGQSGRGGQNGNRGRG